MAPLDRFRKPKPDPAPTPNNPRGGSGRLNTFGFLDYDEARINAALTGKAGLDVFEKMWRTDADVRRALTMCVVPLVAGTWDVQPYRPRKDVDPTAQAIEQAEFVKWALFEEMMPAWSAHLWEALTVAGRSGFAPFEQVWKLADWQGRQVLTLDTLDLRRPRSIDKFNQDGHRLMSIEQFVAGGAKATGESGPIPMRDLVYYRFGAEGDNWEGQSLLRPAYKHWKYKDGIELIDAIGLEKGTVGTPICYPPTDASEDDLDSAENALKGFRANENAWIVAPGPKQGAGILEGTGWLFEILTPGDAGGTGAGQRVKASLDHHQAAIDASVLAEFMRLGQQAVGARATADVQQNPFWMLVDSFARIVVAAPINRGLIPRLVDLNFTKAGGYPSLTCSQVDSTSITDLATYVKTLADAGAIRPEPSLEEFLREKAHLPEADEDAIAEQEQQKAQEARQQMAHDLALKAAATPPAGQKPGGGPQQLSLDAEPVTLARQDRPLKPHEMFVALDRIESIVDGARDSFQQACGEHAHALAVDLAAQAAGGKAPKPAGAPDELVAAIETELERLYSVGQETVRDELQAQHPLADLGAVTLARGGFAAKLAARARLAADAIRATIVQALGRQAIVRDDHASLQAAAEQAALGALKTQAQDHAMAALNLGRADQADQMSDVIAGSRYTAILDGRQCRNCAQADDDVLRPLDDPVRLSRVPPNPDCLGGARCRCLEVYELKDEAPAGA